MLRFVYSRTQPMSHHIGGVTAAVGVVVAVDCVVDVVTVVDFVVVVVVVIAVDVVVAVVVVTFVPQEDNITDATNSKLNPNHKILFFIAYSPFP